MSCHCRLLPVFCSGCSAVTMTVTKRTSKIWFSVERMMRCQITLYDYRSCTGSSATRRFKDRRELSGFIEWLISLPISYNLGMTATLFAESWFIWSNKVASLYQWHRRGGRGVLDRKTSASTRRHSERTDERDTRPR